MVPPVRNLTSRPLTGAWVETPIATEDCTETQSRPLTGAWVETGDCAGSRRRATRRPLTGAWVETAPSSVSSPRNSVAPLRGRGSKLLRSERRQADLKSPPYGGVGRNTAYGEASFGTATVAPLRGRGSKPSVGGRHDRRQRRRPLTGAWVETVDRDTEPAAAARRPLTGAWVETSRSERQRSRPRSSPPYGGVGRNCRFDKLETDRATVAPLRGRGSKPEQYHLSAHASRRPLTGAWVETALGHFRLPAVRCRPLTGAWVETLGKHSRRPYRWTSPPYGGVGRNSWTGMFGNTGLGVAPLRGRGSKL